MKLGAAQLRRLRRGLPAANGSVPECKREENVGITQRIVIKNEDITKVLSDEAAILQTVMNDTKAPCWRPDPASTGPCQVK